MVLRGSILSLAMITLPVALVIYLFPVLGMIFLGLLGAIPFILHFILRYFQISIHLF